MTIEYGSRPLWWRLTRRLVLWWVRRVIERHVRFLERTRFDRSNMSYAKVELRKARIAYWRKTFGPWGDWNRFGFRCFVFDYIEGDYDNIMEGELDSLGFNRKLDWEDSWDT